MRKPNPNVKSASADARASKDYQRELAAQQAGESVASIVAAERLRISAILESEDGLARPGMALELALRTNLDPESAKALLAKAPLAESKFASAMEAWAAKNELPGPSAAHIAHDVRARRVAEIGETMKAINAARRPTTPGV